jgi:hypothetical protein
MKKSFFYELIPKKRKAQITIFIIFGLIIVVLILMFYFVKKPPKIEVVEDNNPQSYIETCSRESVEDAIQILSEQGGDITPKGSLNFKGDAITYLCFTNIHYRECINQRPLLVEHIEKEITDFITPKIERCFNDLEVNLEKRYDSIDNPAEMKVRTNIYPRQVIVNIDKKFKMTNGNKVIEYNSFIMKDIHPIYNFAEIAMDIVNQEIRYCNFDSLGFMILYPEFDITNTITGDSDSIYTIQERSTKEEFKFAVRSCPLPPGF